MTPDINLIDRFSRRRVSLPASLSILPFQNVENGLYIWLRKIDCCTGVTESLRGRDQKGLLVKE